MSGEPQLLPPAWIERTLADLVVERVEQGEPTDQAVPYVDIGSIDRSSKRIVGATTVNRSTAPTRARQWIRRGDVLVSMTRPNLNAVALVTDLHDGSIASTGFDVLRPRASCLPEWIYYRVRSQLFIQDVCRDLQGVVYPAVRPRDIRRHRLPVPPIEQQRSVVAAIDSHFSRLDAATSTLERVQRNLERYRASVLMAAVEGRLVPTEAELARKDGRSYEPASVLLKRILAERRRRWEEAELAKLKSKGRSPTDDRWKARYEEPVAPDTDGLPELPEGWCWASVDQVTVGDRMCAYGVLVPGPDVLDGVPLVRVGDIDDGRVRVTELKRITRAIADRFSKTYLRGGEVLLTLVGTIGRVAVVPRALAGANVARAVGVIPTSDHVDPTWVCAWFRSPEMHARMVGKSHEVARKTLNLEDVRVAAVALPPQAEQTRIVERVSDLDSLAGSAQRAADAALKRICRLRQSILAWAFDGRLVDGESRATRLDARARIGKNATDAPSARR